MTLREAIQIQIKALQEIYDNCGYLRDGATQHEKNFYNECRGSLANTIRNLSTLDNTMSRARAAEPVTGDYSITITVPDKF